MTIGTSSSRDDVEETGVSGFVLPAALMILMVISLVAVSIQTLTYLQRQIAGNAEEKSQQHWAVTGAVHHVVHRLISDTPTYTREAWGEGLSVDVNGLVVQVTVADVASYLDLNRSSVAQMSARLQTRSIGAKRADELASLIADWRDPDDLVRVNGAELDAYLRAGTGVAGPGNRKFHTTSEVAQVLSITEAEIQIIKSDFTVYGGRTRGLANAPVGEPPMQLKPGTSLRIEAVCCADAQRVHVLRSVITLTGDPANPFWIRQWETRLSPGP